MTALQLVSHHLCPYVQRALIVAAEKGVPVERTDIDLAAKPAWFLALSPTGKVPLLRVGDVVLFESAAICEYLDETTAGRLHPEDPLERARHRAWIEQASTTLATIAQLYGASDAAGLATARSALEERFRRIGAELGDGPWFAGERFSLVDAAWAPVFRYLDTLEPRLGALTGDAGDRLDAWRSALAGRASVRNAVAADYPQRLERFLASRRSHLARSFETAA